MKLNQTGERNSLDTEHAHAANRQVEALRSSLEENDKQIARDQDLLEHDRDIRNLIGARNVYMAEIYGVAKSGDTQKPFGRASSTKDKSPVLYGYDLDQQHRAKQNNSLQPWGRGVDQQHSISLGLLYLDDANQKRWVLKFNNAKQYRKQVPYSLPSSPREAAQSPVASRCCSPPSASIQNHPLDPEAANLRNLVIHDIDTSRG